MEPEAATRALAWTPLHNEDWTCGAAFGDLNRDGRLDLVRRRRGRPGVNHEVRALIRRMADANVGWGAPRGRLSR